ncbi:hypothetical protein AAAC51_36490 [Priestia megaterium]
MNITEKSYSIKIYKSEVTLYYSSDKIIAIVSSNGYGHKYEFIYDPDKYSYLHQGKSLNEKMLQHYITEAFQKPFQQIIGEEIAMAIEE